MEAILIYIYLKKIKKSGIIVSIKTQGGMLHESA